MADPSWRSSPPSSGRNVHAGVPSIYQQQRPARTGQLPADANGVGQTQQQGLGLHASAGAGRNGGAMRSPPAVAVPPSGQPMQV